MKLDVALSVEGKHLPAIARTVAAAEELGFDALWTSETTHDPFLPLALAAEHSSRIRLGTAVAIAFARSPMVVAQTAWDVQDFSAGRLLLGLGTQVKPHIERRFGMPWSAPAPRLREYIGALRAIWRSFQTGAPLEYKGEHYHLSLLTPFFNPGPIEHSHIPVSIAGVNEALARLAGEACDGFHVHPFHSAHYLRSLVRPAIEAGAARAARSIDDVELAASVFVITGRGGKLAEQRERMRAQAAFYASTPSYRAVLEAHGRQEVGGQLAKLVRAGRWNEMPALISDEMLRELAVEAAPDELGALLRERYSGLVDRIALYLAFEPGADDAFWKGLLRDLSQA